MKRWQTWTLVCVLGLVMVLYGCVSEGTKGCNDQNRQIGEKVEEKGAALGDAELAQQGSDCKENSKAMAKEIGQPKTPLPYTPANSAKLRAEIPTKPWYLRALDSIWEIGGAFLLGGGAANLAGRFLPALAGPWGPIVTTLIGAIAKGRAVAETKTTAPDAIKAILTTLESELVDNPGQQKIVKAMAKAVEADEEIEHKVVLRA